MLAPDDTADLVADLRALTARDRRDVLASLSATEQARITALISESLVAKPGPATPSPAADTPLFRAFSPWVATRMQQSQDGSTAGGAANLTPATRRLLAQIGQEMAAKEHGDEVPEAEVVEGRSLLGVLGELFSSRRGGR